LTVVVFRIEYKHGPMNYRAGQLTHLPDAEATALAEKGVVEIRHPHLFTETKGEGNP